MYTKCIYINLWKQIAKEFKDFNEYLIFESMNEPTFLYLYDYNYDTLLNFTQSFVDTIRNSEKFNKERLLIISGMSSKIDLTCSQKFKMPTDPANKLAISINLFVSFQLFFQNIIYKNYKLINLFNMIVYILLFLSILRKCIM